MVALKVAYIGWNYRGYELPKSEGGGEPQSLLTTIEGLLRFALYRARLVESPNTAFVMAAGRTDALVCALEQVVLVRIRSRVGSVDQTGGEYSEEQNVNEYDYPGFINKCLPRDIRVLAWAPAPKYFNPRYDCRSRTYSYFFQRGRLDIARMRQAAADFLGEHDFRQLCKWSSNKDGEMKHMVRTVDAVSIEPASQEPWWGLSRFRPPQSSSDQSHDKSSVDCPESAGSDRSLVQTAHADKDEIYVFKVTAHSFLYHQIRYMVAALIAVGEGRESVSFVRELLHPDQLLQGKVQMDIAPGTPLFLSEIDYPNLSWRSTDSFSLRQLRENAAYQALRFWLANACVHKASECLKGATGPVNRQLNTVAVYPDYFLGHSNLRPSKKEYKPVFERPRYLSVAEYIKHRMLTGIASPNRNTPKEWYPQLEASRMVFFAHYK